MHEPFLYDLVRAHERDLRAAAEQHRLVGSARSDRPAFFDRLRAAGTLGWLLRGARRPAPTRDPAAPAAAGRPSRLPCRRPDPIHPAESSC